MAGSLTDTWENTALDAILGKTAISTSSIYLALFTSDPGETGDTANEVSGGDYARVDISSAMGDSSGGSSSNTSDIVFNTATADWGTVTHIGIMDDASAGTMRIHASLDSSADVTNGSTFKILTGNLTVSLN